MTMQQDELRRNILNELAKFDLVSAFWLIVRTLLEWENKLYQKRIISRPKQVPEAFKFHLDHIEFKTDQEKVKREGKVLSEDQLALFAEQWASQLAELPFNDTIHIFALAVSDWLQTSDLTPLTPEKERTMDRVYVFLM